MIIGIDAKSLSKRYTGIAIYVHEMLRYFNEIACDDDQFYLFSNRDFDMDLELSDKFHKVIYHSLTGSFGVMFQMGKYVKKYNIDVFWSPEHIAPLTKIECKIVVTIHDLAILRFPETGERYNKFLQDVFVFRSCRKADRIIAISKATANDIVKLCKINADKVQVIYNGDSPYTGKSSTLTAIDNSTIKNKFGIDCPYFLFVGTFSPRKNIVTIIKAYNEFRRRNNCKYKLVLAGGFGWKYENILEEIEKSSYKQDIVKTGFCSDKEREYLYRNAFALLYPSLYEGFGLPILEAMSVGAPVITSNVSSMPEVGGNVAFYVNNVYDADELCCRMQELCSLPENDLNKLKLDSKIHAAKFSRKKCAEEIYDVFFRISQICEF